MDGMRTVSPQWWWIGQLLWKTAMKYVPNRGEKGPGSLLDATQKRQMQKIASWKIQAVVLRNYKTWHWINCQLTGTLDLLHSKVPGQEGTPTQITSGHTVMGRGLLNLLSSDKERTANEGPWHAWATARGQSGGGRENMEDSDRRWGWEQPGASSCSTR